MRFQIRYQLNAESQTDEIEANSPEEAVVKFEQLRGAQPIHRPGTVRVTSVSATDVAGPLAW